MELWQKTLLLRPFYDPIHAYSLKVKKPEKCCPNSMPCLEYVQKRSMRSFPASDPVVDELPEEKPLLVLRMSWTAIFGTCGTGSFRCEPSGFEMMSPILSPDDWVGTYGCSMLVEGSMGARAGTCCKDNCRSCGS